MPLTSGVPAGAVARVTGPGQRPDVWRRRVAASPLATVSELRGLAADRPTLLTFSAHPDDPHPDHRAVGRRLARVGAQLAVPVWFFPVWLTCWSDPRSDLGGTLRTLAVEDVDDQTRDAAVACSASRLEPGAPGWSPVVPPEMLAHHDRQLLVRPPGDPW